MMKIKVKKKLNKELFCCSKIHQLPIPYQKIIKYFNHDKTSHTIIFCYLQVIYELFCFFLSSHILSKTARISSERFYSFKYQVRKEINSIQMYGIKFQLKCFQNNDMTKLHHKNSNQISHNIFINYQNYLPRG